jgi:hypothetical protein
MPQTAITGIKRSPVAAYYCKMTRAMPEVCVPTCRFAEAVLVVTAGRMFLQLFVPITEPAHFIFAGLFTG